MLSYAYVTASCPPLRDGIESTSKSILVVPLRALPSLANPREARYQEHRARTAEAGAVEDVLDVAVVIDDDGRLIPAASIGQRQ